MTDDTIDAAAHTAHDAADTAHPDQDVHDTVDKTADTVKDTASTIADASRDALDTARDLAETNVGRLRAAYDRNPRRIILIGAGIGAAILALTIGLTRHSR